ncbi:unnamed protein product, partial [Mesorhabditis spiculigera]
MEEKHQKTFLRWILHFFCCTSPKKQPTRVPAWPLPAPLFPPPPPPPVAKWKKSSRRASVAAGAQKDQRTNSTTRTRRHSTAASMRKRPDASRKLSSLSAQMNPNIEAAFSSWKREKRRES